MKRFLFLAISFVAFIPTCFPLFAQEKEVTLEEVVVTATRDVEEIRKIPANVTVISKEKIEASNAQIVVDVLRDEVGVVVEDLFGNGKSATVDIRGFGETAPSNVLVLVDGRRVNNIDLSGVDWTQIPLEQIERIEIVRGPGSVLYGDNAVGGVINIITKRPEKTLSVDAGVIAGSYSFNKETASVSGRWGPFSAILNASYNATDGYRHNGFLRARDIGGKVIYDLSETISLNFSGGFHGDDQGLPGGLTRKEISKLGRQATVNPDDHAQTDDEYGSLGIKAQLWDYGRIEADLSYRNREVHDFFVSSKFSDTRNLKTWGFTPRYILEKSLLGHSNKLTFGVDLYKADSEVDSEITFNGFTSFNRVDVTKKSAGLYLLDEFSILENLIFSAGYRQEWVIFDLSQEKPRANDTVRDSEPAWNFGLDYLFDKKSSAFLTYKRSFRFPVSDELIQFFPLFQVNPLIKPQTGYHYEAGIRHVFTDQIEANLTLYWTDIRDEIFFDPITFTNTNLPRTRRQGIEVGVKTHPFPWLTVWGNYGYVKPQIRSQEFSGSDIPMVPRHKGSIGSDVKFWKGFLFSTKANIVGARFLISDFTNKFQRLDSYYTVDAKLSYGWKGLKALLGVNNLFNRKYAEFGAVNFLGTESFYPSPTRNFFGGVSYTF